MLIQNASSAAPTPRLSGDSAPARVTAPQTQATQVELPQIAIEATAETSAAQLTPAQLQSTVDSMNKTMMQINSNLEFSIDHDTKKPVVKVVESGTGTVIRQYPSEEILSIAREIDKMQKQGMLLKQKT